MRMGQDVLSDLRSALGLEWLVADGLGGTASGTVVGAHTRRTHALLTATRPYGRPLTLLLQLGERLHTQGAWHAISSNIVGGPVVRPAGHEMLEEFALDPWPIWRLRIGETRLEKSLFLIEGHQAVAVTYRHLEGPPARLAVSPMVVARDARALRREGDFPAAATQKVPGRIRIELGADLPPITLWHNGSFLPARVWVRDLAYPAEAGEAREDALVPCHVETTLTAGAEMQIVASAEDDLFRMLAGEERLGATPPRTLRECVAVLARENHREWAKWQATSMRALDFTARQAMVAHGGAPTPPGRRLEPLIARDDVWAPRLADTLYALLARRGDRMTLLASLPGARERGADALRAVPALVTLRAFDLAREVLRGYVEYLDEGLAPESFGGEDGLPRYGDPAPSLWLVNAAEMYVRRSEDVAFLKETLYPPLEAMLQSYRSGTRYGIRTDGEGLLGAGEGAAAEQRADLNALWYHALVAMAQMAKLVGRRENGAFYLAWAREQQTRFMERFWDDTRGCVYDAITVHGPRTETRASHLLTVSLAPQLLLPAAAERLVARIERELVTPLGVREAPGAPASLMWVGPYVAAHLRVNQRSDAAQARMREWLESLATLCGRVVLVHVPAALDPEAAADRPRIVGDPCSVVAAAELLRAWVEEVDHSRSAAPLPVS